MHLYMHPRPPAAHPAGAITTEGSPLFLNSVGRISNRKAPVQTMERVFGIP